VEEKHKRSAEDEDERKRLDRELIELLNEVRVAMPGVQVLFGFLLAVPFQQRFAQVSDFQRHAYFATLLFAAVAAALLIAPTAYHRLMFRQHDKKALIKFGNRMAIGALVCLAFAMNGAVLLITDVMFGSTTLVVTVAVLASVYSWLWFGVALTRRAADRDGTDPGLPDESG
jgi:hypothetical protein